MKLQQLRYLCVKLPIKNLNLSKTAESLHTSQPGISRQIQLLEEELGVDIFVRNGKRIVKITPPGQAIIEIAEKNAQRRRKPEANWSGIQRQGERHAGDCHDPYTGTLCASSCHQTLCRTLSPKSNSFCARAVPTQISTLVSSGEADLAIATEAIELFQELVMLPCYQWNRSIIAPPKHPLLKQHPLTLEAIAQYPYHYLRFRIYRSLKNQSGVRIQRVGSECGAYCNRCRRNQNLCGAWFRYWHSGENGFRSRNATNISAQLTPDHLFES